MRNIETKTVATNHSELDLYLRLRTEIENGYLDRASIEIERLRDDPQASTVEMRRLLSARIALKAGFASDALDLILDPMRNEQNLSWSTDPEILEFFRAERSFVRGLALYSIGKFTEGMDEFRRARDCYASMNDSERSLMAEYNRLSGGWNLRSSAPPNDGEFLELSDFVAQARSSRLARPLGLALRQRSGWLQECGKLHAALRDAQEASLLLEGGENRSDENLAWLQTADVLVDMNHIGEARSVLERTLGPYEARVTFARDFVTARVEMRLHDFDPTRYEVTSPLWENKYDRLLEKQREEAPQMAWIWNTEAAELINEIHEAITVKPGGLEGKLLKLLMRGPQIRARLCEALWPGAGSRENLEDRFYRLVSRLNKKFQLVRHDGQAYRLSVAIHFA